MATREHSPETKAQVLAALLEGQSISQVATAYNIPEGTVKSWKNRQKGEPLASVATPKKEEIGDLLIDYLRTSLRTLKTQAEHFGDKQWLKDQDASSLAVLHGVAMDKAIRLLEALESGGESERGT